MYSLYIDGDSDLHVKGNTDASFKSDRDDSKSQSGIDTGASTTNIGNLILIMENS